MRKTQLRRANLGGADLSYADLRGADLRGADLRGADLTGTRLQGAHLKGALLDQSGAPETADPTPEYVYWSDAGQSMLFRAPITGGGAFSPDTGWSVSTGAYSDPGPLAVDESHVYWVNEGYATVQRVALGSSTPDPSWQVNTGGGSAPDGLAQDASYVYWSESGTGLVRRAAKSGSGAVDGSWQVQAAFVGGEAPQGLAGDGVNVYWGINPSTGASAIGMAPISNPTDINSTAVPNVTGEGITGLSATAGLLWWATSSSPTQVSSVPTSDLSATPMSVTTDVSNPQGVAANGLNVFWANQTGNTIGYAPLSGSGPTTMDLGPVSPVQISGVGVDPNFELSPTVTGVSPGSGATAGGGSVTVLGTGFATGTTVTLGTAPCAVTTIASSGQSLDCTPGASTVDGPVTVTVTNARKQVGTLSNGYTYISPAPVVHTPLLPLAGLGGGTPFAGTEVTINGTGFAVGADVAHTATVTLGGVNCPVILGDSGANQLVCVTAEHDPGVVDLVVQNPYSTPATVNDAFWYQPPNPAPTGISPSLGSTNGGTTVTISGTGFANNATVTIGAVPCTNASTAPDGQTITCTTGQTNSHGPSDVVVTNPAISSPPVDGSSTWDQAGTLSGGYNYRWPAPAVTGVTPQQGTNLGGTSVQVSGTGFQYGATATVGGDPCTQPSVSGNLAASTLTCYTPAGPDGAAAVVVSNTDGQTSAQVLDFTYQTPSPTMNSINPASGDVQGGTVVQIRGSGFDAMATVSIGGQPCTGPAVTDGGTVLTCTTGTHAAGQVDVVVANSATQTGQLSGGFTYGTPEYVYWSDAGQSKLFRAPITGGGAFSPDSGWSVSTGAYSDPGPLAVDESHVYWVNEGYATVQRVALGSSAPDPSWQVNSGGGSAPDGLAQDANYVYWSESGTGLVRRAAKSGSGAVDGSWQVTAGALGGGQAPQGLAGDGVNVYWGINPPGGASAVGMAPISSPTEVNSSAVPNVTGEGITGLSATAGLLWWATSSSPTQVSSVPTSDLSATPMSVTTDISNPQGVAANGIQVFWANQAGNTIGYAPLSGSGPTTIDLSSVSPLQISGVGVDPTLSPLTVTEVSPASGPTAGGGSVTVSGTGFTTATTVTLGGVGCPVTSINPDGQSLTCTPGAHSSGQVDVIAIADLAATTKTDAFTYVNPAPTVTSVDPQSGTTAGGTAVEIRGTGFLPGAVVTFDTSTTCGNVRVTSSTLLTCDTGAHGAATVDVKVTNTDSQSGTLSNAYTYTNGGALYWSNSGGLAGNFLPNCPPPAPADHGGSIGEASSTGGGSPNQCLAVTEEYGTPLGVFSDGTYVYWADPAYSQIWRADVAGTNPTVLVDLSTLSTYATPQAVAVDAAYVYWADPSGVPGQEIRRAPLAGFTPGSPITPDPNWYVNTGTTGQTSPVAMVIDSTYVYWADQKAGVVAKANLSDGSVVSGWSVSVTGVTGVAVDSTYIYWSNPGTTRQNGGFINRALLATPGTPDSSFSVTTIQPRGITIDSQYVYWTDTSGGLDVGQGTIGRVPLTNNGPAGTGVNFITGATQPVGISIHENS